MKKNTKRIGECTVRENAKKGYYLIANWWVNDTMELAEGFTPLRRCVKTEFDGWHPSGEEYVVIREEDTDKVFGYFGAGYQKITSLKEGLRS